MVLIRLLAPVVHARVRSIASPTCAAGLDAQAPFGLYAEQLSGTAFTVPRDSNRRRYVSAASTCACLWLCVTAAVAWCLRSWLYRIRPSVMHDKFVKHEHSAFQGGVSKLKSDPNQFRWGPIPHADAATPTTFVEGIKMQGAARCGAG